MPMFRGLYTNFMSVTRIVDLLVYCRISESLLILWTCLICLTRLALHALLY